MTNEQQDACQRALVDAYKKAVAARGTLIVMVKDAGNGEDVRSAIRALEDAESNLSKAFDRIVGGKIP